MADALPLPATGSVSTSASAPVAPPASPAAGGVAGSGPGGAQGGAAFALPGGQAVPGAGGAGAAGGSTPPAAATATSAATAAAATTATTASSAVASAAQVAPILAAAQAALASSVNLSPQAQQSMRAEAFSQLVAGLVQQIQAGAVAQPSTWPAAGVSGAVQALLSALVQHSTASQALPQQLLSVQAWPMTLAQAVLQQAGQAATGQPAARPAVAAEASAPDPAHRSGQSAAAPAQTPTSPGAAAPRPHIPALQTWLVLQGSVQAQDGPRGFSMTLQVPQVWAQAQAAWAAAQSPAMQTRGQTSGSAALPAPASPATGNPASPAAALLPSMTGGLHIPFAGSMQQLGNAAFGLVLQPQARPDLPQATQAQLQALRTSAILQLEWQPLPAQAAQSSAQAVAAFAPALLPQEWQALLQGRATDPWLLMAQNQASGQQPRQSTYASEQSGLCVVEGCQYLGRAICAQPFCAEMNYLWSVARAQGRA